MTDKQIKELADKIAPRVWRLVMWETFKWALLIGFALVLGTVLARALIWLVDKT